MRESYLDYRYRDHPRCGWVPLGPWPQGVMSEGARPGVDFIDVRPRAHAVVVVPGRIVLLRFARRAKLADMEHLERERGLIPQTPELAVLRSLPIEARLVYCDCFAGIEDAARSRGIRLALYAPWLLLRWRDRAGRKPGEVFHPHNFDPDSLRRWLAEHGRAAVRRGSTIEGSARGSDSIMGRDASAHSPNRCGG